MIGNKLYYILIPFFCVLFLFFCLLNIRLSINKNKVIIFFVFLILSLFSFFFNSHDVGRFYTISFFLFFIIIYASVRLSWISDDDFVFYSNLYFCFFLFISLIGYFYGTFQLKENGLIGGFMSLPGVEGSPAHIDVFALLILLLNIFYCRKKLQRNFIVLLAFSVVLMAGTTAPIFSLMMVFAAYIALVFGFSKSTILVSYFVFAVSFILYSSFNNSYYDFFVSLTNGRSYIWEYQLSNFFNGLDINKVLFGHVGSTVVDIYWGSGSTNNPHNAYLFIIFRFGIVAFLLSIFILAYKSISLSKKRFFILVALISAGMSGVTVVYISNPYYLLLLSFVFMNNDGGLKNKRVGHEI